MHPGDPRDPRGLKITFKPIFYDQKCMESKIPGSKTIFDASKSRKNQTTKIQKINLKTNFYDQKIMLSKIPGSKNMFIWTKKPK